MQIGGGRMENLSFRLKMQLDYWEVTFGLQSQHERTQLFCLRDQRKVFYKHSTTNQTFKIGFQIFKYVYTKDKLQNSGYTSTKPVPGGTEIPLRIINSTHYNQDNANHIHENWTKQKNGYSLMLAAIINVANRNTFRTLICAQFSTQTRHRPLVYEQSMLKKTKCWFARSFRHCYTKNCAQNSNFGACLF